MEEEPYLTESKNVSDYISNTKMPRNFNGYFIENKHANHITNFWVSLPPIFTDAYSSYNSILNDWFYIKLKRDTIKNPIEEFKSDLVQVSEKLGFEVNPNLTQIFSLTSSFKYDKKNLKRAIDFIQLGQQYYPNYADFDLELIELYKQLDDLKMVQYYKTAYRKKVTSRKDLSDAEKAELLKNID